MKLTDIDLNDKTEVAAAHALLAAVLGEAIPQITVTNRVGEISQTATGSVQQLAQAGVIEQNPAAVFAQPGQLPDGAQPLQDAAAVFGGQQSATPLPGTLAPSIAGADQSSTALAGLPGISSGPSALPATQMPAAHIAPGALVPGGAVAMGQPAGLTNPAPGVELDSKGLPWDARIHASTKSKKKDGTWTALRGLNDAAKVAAIEAELRATVQGQQLGAIVQAQGATPLPQAGVSASAGTPSGLPLATASTGLPPSADPVTFEQLMPRVTQATISGILPPTALQQVCGALGLQSVVALQTNPAFVPHAWAQLKAAYPALQ